MPGNSKRGWPKGTKKTEQEKREAHVRRRVEARRQREETRRHEEENRHLSQAMTHFLTGRNEGENPVVPPPPPPADLPPRTECYEYEGERFYDAELEFDRLGNDDWDDWDTPEDDEDGGDSGDEWEESNLSTMSLYLEGIVGRLQEETSTTRTCLNKWLLDIASQHQYWIPSSYAQQVCQNLNLTFQEEDYYRDVFYGRKGGNLRVESTVYQGIISS